MPKQRRSAKRAVRSRPRRQRENQTGVVGKLLIMLAVVAAVVLGVAIFFQVRTVEVQGNVIYSDEQVSEISGVEPGDNLVMVNRASVMGNIKANLPYVQDVSVGLILPDTVVVKIKESDVAGLVKADVGSEWYINTKGRILGSTSSGFNGQIIELTGFTVVAPAAGQQAVASEGMAENMSAALAVLAEMEETGLMDQVTSVNAEKSYDVRLFCAEQYEIMLGGTDELDYKIWYLQEVLAALDSYQTGMIDLTLDQERAARFIPWLQEEELESQEEEELE